MRSLRAGIVAVVICLSVFGSMGAYSQESSLAWFKFNIPEVDQPANEAIDQLSRGMSDIILSLNGGRRKRKAPVDNELAGRAMGELQSARKGLEGIANNYKISDRKINLDTIRARGYGKAYDALVFSLKQLGYSEPANGKEFMLLLVAVIERSSKDLQILIENRAGQNAVQEAFLDLVAHKVLLEQMGSTSGVITISMQ